MFGLTVELVGLRELDQLAVLEHVGEVTPTRQEGLTLQSGTCLGGLRILR